jgi:hypothetical protein
MNFLNEAAEQSKNLPDKEKLLMFTMFPKMLNELVHAPRSDEWAGKMTGFLTELFSHFEQIKAVPDSENKHDYTILGEGIVEALASLCQESDASSEIRDLAVKLMAQVAISV